MNRSIGDLKKYRIDKNGKINFFLAVNYLRWDCRPFNNIPFFIPPKRNLATH